MKIVRALPADAQALTEIALASKRHWNYPEQWMAEWTPQLTLTPDYIAANEVHVTLDDGRRMGFYALTGTGCQLALDHLWVLPAAIGIGIGRALFAHAVQCARALGAKALEIEAEPNALGFYQRMGAREIGRRRTEVAGTARDLPILLYEIRPVKAAGV